MPENIFENQKKGKTGETGSTHYILIYDFVSVRVIYI